MKKRFGVRISHGISQEEYDKWSTSEMGSVSIPEASPAPLTRPIEAHSPKAAA